VGTGLDRGPGVSHCAGGLWRDRRPGCSRVNPAPTTFPRRTFETRRPGKTSDESLTSPLSRMWSVSRQRGRASRSRARSVSCDDVQRAPLGGQADRPVFRVGALSITRSELSVRVRRRCCANGSTQLVHDGRRVGPLFPGHGDECFQECFC
jgi:hypothetical protein